MKDLYHVTFVRSRMVENNELIPDFLNLKRDDAIGIFAGQIALYTALTNIQNGRIGLGELAAIDSAIQQTRTLVAFLKKRYSITEREYLEYVERMIRDIDKELSINVDKNIPGYS